MWRSMAQIHFYVPDEIEQVIRQQAKSQGMTLSRFVAELVRRSIATGWPEGYFDQVIGGWQGEPLERSDQGSFERRTEL